MTLEEQRALLFDENFHPRVADTNKIISFCQILTQHTGVQCCTAAGAMFEWLPAVYLSVVKSLA